MPYVDVWIHLVWATKCRRPLLAQSFLEQICNHIHLQAASKGIRLDHINGYRDHMHALIALKGSQTVGNVVQLLKGESSHRVNRQEWFRGTFEWQDEYAAFSVSRYELDFVRKYIENQTEHHRVRTFAEECDELRVQIISKWG